MAEDEDEKTVLQVCHVYVALCVVVVVLHCCCSVAVLCSAVAELC